MIYGEMGFIESNFSMPLYPNVTHRIEMEALPVKGEILPDIILENSDGVLCLGLHELTVLSMMQRDDTIYFRVSCSCCNYIGMYWIKI